jgi:hypothetical protein
MSRRPNTQPTAVVLTRCSPNQIPVCTAVQRPQRSGITRVFNRVTVLQPLYVPTVAANALFHLRSSVLLQCGTDDLEYAWEI